MERFSVEVGVWDHGSGFWGEIGKWRAASCTLALLSVEHTDLRAITAEECSRTERVSFSRRAINLRSALFVVVHASKGPAAEDLARS